jgi:hypothetical protein
MSAEIGVRPDEELQDLPFQEEPPLPLEYDGQCMSIAERIRGRLHERMVDTAAHQKRNP